MGAHSNVAPNSSSVTVPKENGRSLTATHDHQKLSKYRQAVFAPEISRRH